MTTAKATAKPKPCPRSPSGSHDRYSDGTCCHCHQGAPAPAPETTAFQAGEALAYSRVLALLTGLAEQEATKGRDHGRGVAHGAAEVRQAVLDLAEDAGLIDLVNPQSP